MIDCIILIASAPSINEIHSSALHQMLFLFKLSFFLTSRGSFSISVSFSFSSTSSATAFSACSVIPLTVQWLMFVVLLCSYYLSLSELIIVSAITFCLLFLAASASVVAVMIKVVLSFFFTMYCMPCNLYP